MIKYAAGIAVILSGTFLLVAFALPPRGRYHTATKAKKQTLLPATSVPAVASQVSIVVEGDVRIIRANGIPNHKTGAFPNRNNPSRISAQHSIYRIPAKPEYAQHTTPLGMHNFGIAINGVPFDPGAAEFYKGDARGGWQYEPLSGAIAMGIDVSHAHVQPTGAYHYHGLPTQLLSSVNLQPDRHSPLIGWAADGFPMYAVYGFSDPEDATSPVIGLKSSYRLRRGRRPGGALAPSGKYDGTFIADYEFVEARGDLDECNGRFTVTPEFPQGTYAYFLTENWPVIPRHYRGTPSKDFTRRGDGHPWSTGPGRTRAPAAGAHLRRQPLAEDQ